MHLTLWSRIFLETLNLCSLYLVELEDRVHQILPFDPIMNRTNPVHILISYSFEINFNIILPSAPWPSKRIRSVRFSYHIDKTENK